MPESSTFHPAFSAYQLDGPETFGAYDEMFDAGGSPRPQYGALYRRLLDLPAEELRYRQQAADLSFLNQGITFTVYGQEQGTERIFPYDLVPRILTAAEWQTIERGLTQRIIALNLFLKDIYHRAGRWPKGSSRASWCTVAATTAARCAGSTVPRDIYTTVVGTDLVRVERRAVPGAGRQPARAERRLVHARQPAGDEAGLPAPLRRLRRAAD